MEVQECLNYRKDLLEGSQDEDGFVQQSLFLNQVIPSLLDAKLIDSEDWSDSYYFYEAENLKLNGYSVNESGERLHLFVVDENSIDINISEENLLNSTKGYYENQFKRVQKFLNKAVKGLLNDEVQDADPIRPLVTQLSSAEGNNQFDVVEIFLISALATIETRGAEPQPKRIDFEDDILKVSFSRNGEKITKEILIIKKLIDLNYLYNILLSKGNREALIIDFEKMFNYDVEVINAATEENFESYLCVLPASILAELYRRYSTRLLEKNVRSFLQFRGVNKGIRDTIRLNPEKFIAFNNGITVTSIAKTLKVVDGKSYITSLTDFQIVNGGQTTASIYFTKKDGYSIDKVKVMAKINVAVDVSDDKLDELISDISKYSNSQTKVSTVDLSSRNPYLLKIKTLSETVISPSGNKWFFERARGEINTLIRRHNNRKALLESEFPKSRRITKEQLAKYFVSWGEQPYLVKKGGEKVFRIFITNLERDFPLTDDLDITFFEDIIAKTILFKEMETIYGSGKKSIGQIRSAVVPYSISLIFKYTNDNRTTSSFKLFDLWRENGVDESTRDFLKRLMELVNYLLVNNKLTDDVNESTKKQEQWNLIKDMKEVRDFFKESENVKVLSKHKYTVEQLEKRYPENLHFIEETSSISPDTWFALSKWAKENEKFGTAERRFLYTIGKYASNPKGLSAKQSKWAYALLQQGKEMGFDNN